METCEALKPFHYLQADAPPGPQLPSPAPVLQELLSPSTVLYTGRRDDHGQNQAKRIDYEVTCAAVDVLMGIVPVAPAVAVVLID